MKSLKQFILTSALAISVLLFAGFFFFGTALFDSFVRSQSHENAKAISLQTFTSMYQVMKKGWTRNELEEFIGSTKEALGASGIDVEIYRGGKVEELFGTVEQRPMDGVVRAAFASGEPYSGREGDKIRYVYPIRAQAECQKCHVNAQPGDVLGAIDTTQDMEAQVAEARNHFILILLLTAPLPLLAAWLVARLVTRKTDRSLDALRREIDGIQSLADLKSFQSSPADLGFSELNALSSGLGELAGKVREIAADKELLEFEVKLLDKFIITSEVVRDWKEHVRELLIEINRVIPAYSLFVIFKTEEEGYDLEIFWYRTPAEETKALFEEIAGERVRENPYFSEAVHLEVHHHVADSFEPLGRLDRADIELQTKSLILATPKIGGVVGIGVQSLLSLDPTRHIVVESILTTLVNVVGSVKAIYKYTRDLEYYATRDPLTNLYNQRVFRELLSYEVDRTDRHRESFALIVIDFDNFKLVNDRYGHSFGDEFLKAFAIKLRESIEQGDILSRYGGDEFTVILPGCQSQRAMEVAETIREKMEGVTMNTPGGEKVKATISLGVALYPDHANDEKELFVIADSMMYKAKKEGKNRFALPSDSDIAEAFRQAGERSQLVLRAVEEKLLVPFFQPIKEIGSDTIVIHEMLMRLQDGEKLVTANEFIETAENLGVVHKLDLILIEKAFTKMRNEKYDGILFVNLSPRAFIIGEFVGEVRKLATEYGVEPGRVVFEITERDTVKNMSLLEKFIHDLKYEGFKFAIDDFGSGFSSYHYLKRFPIDFIKVEGEFVRNVLQDPTDRAFVNSIITLAKELGIKTVAEYVEDEEIYEAVKKMGVDYAQGYHVAKPGRDFVS